MSAAGDSPPARHGLRPGRLGGLLCLLALLLACFAVSTPAVAAPSDRAFERLSEARGVVGKRLTRPPERIIEHWTPKRMRSAEPIELRRDEPSLGTSTQPASHDAVISAEVTDTASYPHRTHGKVFFEIDGSAYVCSGTSVPSGTDDLVLTAGHCVFDFGEPPEFTNEFVDNLVFVPGYRNGERPFGTWAAHRLVTTPGWVDGDFNRDVAFARVSPVGGEDLERVLGARGLAFFQPRDQQYQAFGYPAAAPFDGQRMWLCTSAYAGDDPFTAPPPPAAIGIGCDMTGGSSGGSWIIDGGHAASVTSFGYGSLPDHLYGPYFGADAKTLYAGIDGETAAPKNLVDSVPPGPEQPQTTIVAGPAEGATLREREVEFAFTSNRADALFECSLDGAAFSACDSPRQLLGLADGPHHFEVRARMPAGSADPTPAARRFAVDTAVLSPRLEAASVQRIRGKRLIVKARGGAAEPVRLLGRGSVRIRARRALRLRPARADVEAGQLAPLTLRAAKAKHRRQILRALRKGRRVRATLRLELRDSIGNTASATRRVRLR